MQYFTPINLILDAIKENCPIKGDLMIRHLDGGDTIVKLPNDRLRVIRGKASLRKAYQSTAGLPILHPRVIIGTESEWERAVA
jgi:hypothetical protein